MTPPELCAVGEGEGSVADEVPEEEPEDDPVDDPAEEPEDDPEDDPEGDPAEEPEVEPEEDPGSEEAEVEVVLAMFFGDAPQPAAISALESSAKAREEELKKRNEMHLLQKFEVVSLPRQIAAEERSSGSQPLGAK